MTHSQETFYPLLLLPPLLYVKEPSFLGVAMPAEDRCERGCSFFAYSWKLPAHSGAFLLTADNLSFFTYSWSFFAYSFSFFTYNWSFFAYRGKVRLISAFRDCKQRSLTANKKAPTVSKKASPKFFRAI